MTWHEGLLFRSAKEIKTKGELFRRCLKSYRSKTKDHIKSTVIADRADLSTSRLANFVQGQWEDIPDINLEQVLISVKLSRARFNELAKKTAIPLLGMYASDFLQNVDTAAKPTTAPTPKKAYKPEVVKSTNKPAAKTTAGSAGIEIENHTFEAFIAMVDATGKIHLYYNSPDIAKKCGKGKWSYVAPADEVAGLIKSRVSKI